MLRNLLLGFMRPINTNLIILLGMWTALWGVWVAMPMWDAFESAKMFTYMESLFPEWVWGTAAIISGLVMCFGVLFNSFRSLSFGAWVGFVFWTAVSIMYFIGDWQNTGGITVIAFAVYSAVIRINLSVNKEFFTEPS